MNIVNAEFSKRLASLLIGLLLIPIFAYCSDEPDNNNITDPTHTLENLALALSD